MMKTKNISNIKIEDVALYMNAKTKRVGIKLINPKYNLEVLSNFSVSNVDESILAPRKNILRIHVDNDNIVLPDVAEQSGNSIISETDLNIISIGGNLMFPLYSDINIIPSEYSYNTLLNESRSGIIKLHRAVNLFNNELKSLCIKDSDINITLESFGKINSIGGYQILKPGGDLWNLNYITNDSGKTSSSGVLSQDLYMFPSKHYDRIVYFKFLYRNSESHMKGSITGELSDILSIKLALGLEIIASNGGNLIYYYDNINVNTNDNFFFSGGTGQNAINWVDGPIEYLENIRRASNTISFIVPANENLVVSLRKNYISSGHYDTSKDFAIYTELLEQRLGI